MSAVSKTAAERARNFRALIASRLNGDETQAAMAIAIGVSAPTVNRLITEHLDKFCALLAHSGLKVVDQSMCCVSRETYDFLTATHQRVMQRAPQLIWDVDE